MSHILKKTALILLFPGVCPAQSFTASEALDRYLARPRDQQPGCSGLAFTVQIDASMPKLGKQGSMHGLKEVSQTGRVVYRDLRFTGDNLIKTAVIARFLAHEAESHEATAGVTRENYAFVHEKTSDYNGLTAFVFRLKPKRKQAGFFRGELWLDANTAEPLRLWGDFVKSPSIFIRSFRFVLDYQNVSQCLEPFRLLLSVQTRIAGDAEMAVWLHSTDSPLAEGSFENSSQ
jgi:hypothetical protein